MQTHRFVLTWCDFSAVAIPGHTCYPGGHAEVSSYRSEKQEQQKKALALPALVLQTQ